MIQMTMRLSSKWALIHRRRRRGLHELKIGEIFLVLSRIGASLEWSLRSLHLPKMVLYLILRIPNPRMSLLIKSIIATSQCSVRKSSKSQKTSRNSKRRPRILTPCSTGSTRTTRGSTSTFYRPKWSSNVATTSTWEYSSTRKRASSVLILQSKEGDQLCRGLNHEPPASRRKTAEANLKRRISPSRRFTRWKSQARTSLLLLNQTRRMRSEWFNEVLTHSMILINKEFFNLILYKAIL